MRSMSTNQRSTYPGILAVALALAVAVPAAAELTPGGSFIDDDGNFHEPNIEAIAAAGITVGCKPPIGDQYCPGDPVSRAEMAAFLLRATGQADNLPAHRGTFPDVPAGQWYTGYVERLAELGFTLGYADGTFRPAGLVTRAEMSMFIVRAIGEEANLAPAGGLFVDVPATAWYGPSTERLYDLGITLGCGTSPLRYCPNDIVLRDQMASFLARAFGLAPIAPPPRPSLAQVRLQLVPVAGGLTQPLFLDAPPGDARLFIVEQPGRIRIVSGGTLIPAPFLDISDQVGTGGERGLLGLAFHPQYAGNGRFYVNYTDTGGATRVVEYLVSNDPNQADRATERVLLTIDQPASNHNGGMLAFGPDGYLYIGMGDGGGGGDPSGNGQRPSTLLGTLLRIDVDRGATYTVPADNPFVAGGGAAEVWAYGLRNPWRFSFDGQRLYVADVGQGKWEEIDVLTTSAGGANLGWSIMEGEHCFNPSSGCSGAGLVLPVFEYGHGEGCSVTGGYVYRGSAIPELAGHYFYGDFCSGWVRSFRYTGNGVANTWDWQADLGTVASLTSFGTDGAGELYAVSGAGTVYRIVRRG
ncbi:MAG: PQQ-dependent sugar dehydrogenase [Acidimicrobiia bacterium]|nr:PQQ-dependent sugar dehydrogenase [Acidimicrobiia bacterium]